MGRWALRLTGLGLAVVFSALLPSPAFAAGAASAWAAPTTLSAESLRYGDYEGSISASRFGVGPRATQICIDLTRHSTLAEGSSVNDSLSGCARNAPLAAYAFDAVRWRAAVRVGVNLAHNRATFGPDGAFLSSASSPAGRARVDLHWIGEGKPKLTAKSGTTYAHFVWVDVLARKAARVSGTVAMPDTVMRLTNVPGAMATGVDT